MSRVPEKPYREENKRRRARLFEAYDPLLGIGSPLERVCVKYTVHDESHEEFFTLEMVQKTPWIQVLRDQGSIENTLREIEVEPTDSAINSFIDLLTRTRLHYDFEYWAFMVGHIQDKESKKVIPFELNKPQRKLLKELEADRVAGKPIRVNIDKARQWGGSTLIQLFMAWIQTEHKMNWHSAIVADVEDQVRNIRHMFSRFAKEYPKDLGSVTLGAYEGSTKNKIIEERGCVIGVGSAQKPDNLRSFDFAMLHLSEVGSFKTTQGRSPEDLMQSLRATVPDVPYSMIVLESTAKGVGNFFHREWLASIEGRSGYRPVFVAWWEVERYQKRIANMSKFINWMVGDEYAMFLWNLGATLEGINWYFYIKKSENYDDWRMASEFPSNWQESFQSTDQRVYPPGYVQKARMACTPPEWVGDITAQSNRGPDALKNVEFFLDPSGLLYVWSLPDTAMKVSNRYAVFVDIGGTTAGADWSVIKVIDRYWLIDGGKPEIAAVWRGHCFVPGTNIYTSKGMKPIEDVKIGDLVWTHKNRFRKVINTYKNKYSGDVLSVRSQGNYETVRCTPEHPFFSNKLISKIEKKPWRYNHEKGYMRYQYHRRNYVGNPIWVDARNLEYIAYSRNKPESITLPFVINKYNGGKSKDTKRVIKDLKSLFSILGYYLAEGHINRRSEDQKPGTIVFSFSYHEINTFAKDCYDKLLKLGFKASIIGYETVSVCRVRCYDTNLASLVLDLCGEHSWSKRINPILFRYSNDLLSELLDSYWKGDGSRYITGNTISNIVTTVSQVLARQIRDILILLGYRPGIYRVKAKTMGKGIKSNRLRYNVVWNESKIKKNAILNGIDNVAYKLKTKKNESYSGYVYNLEVEEDNSYSTECYVVHNCDQDLVAWKAAQIGTFYNKALVAVETNSLNKDENTEGTHYLTVLDEIVPYYDNLYMRTDPEKVRQGLPVQYGFHTNSATKTMIINRHKAALREEEYVEKDIRACDEMDTFELKPSGKQGAVDGCHDDHVITTAGVVWLALRYMPLPVEIIKGSGVKRKKISGEASF